MSSSAIISFLGENKPNLNIGFGYENKPLKTPYEFLLKMKEKHAGI